jgi:putative SOS response-associated peptidase YedK
MAFAGLWEVWRGPAQPAGDPALLRTCAIVTTSANELMAPLHDRMPVILDRTDWDTWLDPASDPASLPKLLVSAPADSLEAYPVSSLVNNVRNEGPELLDPLPARPVRS